MNGINSESARRTRPEPPLDWKIPSRPEQKKRTIIKATLGGEESLADKL